MQNLLDFYSSDIALYSAFITTDYYHVNLHFIFLINHFVYKMSDTRRRTT